MGDQHLYQVHNWRGHCGFTTYTVRETPKGYRVLSASGTPGARAGDMIWKNDVDGGGGLGVWAFGKTPQEAAAKILKYYQHAVSEKQHVLDVVTKKLDRALCSDFALDEGKEKRSP